MANYHQQQGPSPIVREIVDKIGKQPSMDSFKGEELVSIAEKFASHLAKEIRLKTSQIRKFLDAVKRVQSQSLGKKDYDYRTEAMMMKPKLAYAAGRNNEVKPFMEVITPCIDRIKNKQDFDQFSKFIEAIVAYHKYFGGRDN